MLLPVIVVTPLFSFLAGVVWWCCLVIGKRKHEFKTIHLSPLFINVTALGDVVISVVFLKTRFQLFKLPKIKRNKSGSIKT